MNTFTSTADGLARSTSLRRILVLEDDANFVEALQITLRSEFRVEASFDPDQALAMLRRESYWVALVDERLPRGSGLEFIRTVRAEFPDLPIVMITSLPTKELAISCLNLGVKRFLEKPFSLTLLRETVASLSPPAVMQVGASIRLLTNLGRAELNGRNLEFTPIEYRIFLQLAMAQGELVSRKSLSAGVWQNNVVSDHALDTHLSSLKRKLGPLASGLYTVRGKGFRWAP